MAGKYMHPKLMIRESMDIPEDFTNYLLDIHKD